MPSSSGFMIGVVGALLDFASATNVLVSPVQSSGMMTTSGPSPWWILGLYSLGALVLVSSVLSIMAIGFRFARLFSLLMVGYGLAMIASGWIMSTGNMFGSSDAALYGYGMLVVGGLMIVNGAMMTRTPMSM